MPLDTTEKVQERQQWLPLSGPYAGVELLLRQATPAAAEKWRHGLMRVGIMRQTREGGLDTNPGRVDDYFRAFTERYVLDWRGDVRPQGTPFSLDVMTDHVKGNLSLYETICKAVGEDSVFFPSSNGGSTTR